MQEKLQEYFDSTKQNEGEADNSSENRKPKIKLKVSIGEKLKSVVANVRKVQTTLQADLIDRQLTLGHSETGIPLEAVKEFVPPYARPINEKNTMKVVHRKSQREKFKALLLASKRKLTAKDSLLD